MAQDITEKESTRYNRPQTLDTAQLEYSFKQMFVYGISLTLGVTYAYLLIQKIKN